MLENVKKIYPQKNSATQKILTHAFIHLSESMVNGCYKKQALASKDEGPAEIGRAAAARVGDAPY